jgi:ubiquinone/menaquinone biosynthesis C-methylase UbiE
VEIVRGVAEALPFDAARVDSAVVTYTLCSVESPSRALAEVRRVLRPGGRLFFVEHGIAPERDARIRAWQRRITPFWRRIGGNCHLDRDPRRELAEAGFAIEELRADYTEDSPRWLSFTYEGAALR